MPRIRTIKPEFPQSESMGRISRDARLLFIQMWTLADDSGRLRGNSRMLASILFPYDEDAPKLIDGWLSELESENCILRYSGDDKGSYIQISNWLDHQKIDKPSKSKIPEPDSSNPRESSRTVANPLEASIPSRARADQGPRTKEGTKDQGEGEENILAPSFAKREDFQEVWTLWKAHRRQKHKPLAPAEEQQQFYELGRFEADEAIAMVRFSIGRGALNLITNGDHKPKASKFEHSNNKTAKSNHDLIGHLK
jgi:hypothetical protein